MSRRVGLPPSPIRSSLLAYRLARARELIARPLTRAAVSFITTTSLRRLRQRDEAAHRRTTRRKPPDDPAHPPHRLATTLKLHHLIAARIGDRGQHAVGGERGRRAAKAAALGVFEHEAARDEAGVVLELGLRGARDASALHGPVVARRALEWRSATSDSSSRSRDPHAGAPTLAADGGRAGSAARRRLTRARRAPAVARRRAQDQQD